MSDAPTLKPALKALILDALAQKYVSVSSNGTSKTGNAYQAVRLGDEWTKGFRSDRESTLARVRFAWQTVLDLGSNLGENSRIMRRLGAAQIDGVEYDPFFVDLARLINAYNDVAGVSFRQGDITRPEVYDRVYDIVLAFSVHEYTRHRLPELARATRHLLIIETHKIDDDLEQKYLRPIGEFFPVHRVLGETDWGVTGKHDGRRIVLAFARDTMTLDWYLGASDNVGEPNREPRVDRVDRGGSAIDLRRLVTPWLDSFRSRICDFPAPNWPGLERRIVELSPNLDEIRGTHEFSRATSGWCYWAAYLKGYFEFEAGSPAVETTFFRHIKALYRERRFDSGLAKIIDDDAALGQRLGRRYGDTHSIRFCETHRITPISAFPGDGAIVLRTPAGEEIRCARIDGYHRLFSALLAGWHFFPFAVKQFTNPRP